MPRRPAATRAPSPPPQLPPSDSGNGPSTDPLFILRTQWKWAAFSQFFFTFNHLFNMNDVSLSNIEDDLINGTRIVLPRIMQRLLWVLSYDRKVSLDNWQTALRKQYRKRDPTANPIGLEPRVDVPDEHESSPPPEADAAIPQQDPAHVDDNPLDESHHPSPNPEKETPDPAHSTRASTLDPDFSGRAMSEAKGMSVQPSEAESDLKHAGLNGEENDPTEQGESKDWLELTMLAKLDSLHLLTEWQFQNPTRLRTLMRSDDEGASWRIEPIGYDSKKNAYWLIGADRLWIQRALPRLPRPKPTAAASLKRKRGGTTTTAKQTQKNKKPRNEPQAAPFKKHARLNEEIPEGGRGRAAKTQAKLKLDKQALELKEFQRQQQLANSSSRNPRNGKAAAALASGSTRSTRASSSVAPVNLKAGRMARTAAAAAAASGTRASRRLRGTAGTDEDGWQAIPEEWLNEGVDGGGDDDNEASDAEASESDVPNGKAKNGKGKVNGGKTEKEAKTGLESDGSDISELTELSDLSDSGGEGDGDDGQEEQEANAPEDTNDEEEQEDEPEHPPVKIEEPVPPVLPENFIEWETICVTLYEWDHIAERFEKGTHYTERALYKLLVSTLVPGITTELREIERQQQMAAAMTQRKRSSRLLLRQTEREEAEATARKLAEEAERNSRAKRQEARAKREEEAREKRETARETRRREREEKEERERLEREKAERGEDGGDSEQMAVDVVGNGTAPHPSAPAARRREPSGKRPNGKSGNKSGSRTPVGEDWELDCEICHRRGINMDDGVPMMSCGTCSKWQHIACHDQADQKAGRRRRNWDVVEFICLSCRVKQNANAAYRGAGYAHIPQQHNQPPMNPYLAHASIGAAPYNNPYLNPALRQPVYPGARPPANGSASSVYLRDYQGSQTSDLRSTPIQQQPHLPGQSPVQLPSQQHQLYGTPISFTHYQPHQRGFSSGTQQVPYGSGNIQSYGQAAFLNQYSQQYPIPMANGSAARSTQPLQPSSSPQQARWNTTPSTSNFHPQLQLSTQPPLQLNNHTPSDILAPTLSSPVQNHNPVIPPPRSPQLHWQQQDEIHATQQQRIAQLHYHSPPYQSTPS